MWDPLLLRKPRALGCGAFFLVCAVTGSGRGEEKRKGESNMQSDEILALLGYGLLAVHYLLHLLKAY